MGGSSSKFEVLKFNPRDWKVQKENGYCILLRNIHTGDLVQEYDMVLKGDMTIQEQLEFYEYRKKQNKHLVSVLYVMKGDSGRLCTWKDYYKVYTERIPIRLTQIDYLSFPQTLMVIRDSLIGYNQIKESYFGVLKVTKQMIGFTPTGQVKVWINEQFKFNSPESKHIIKGYGNPLTMITQIFSLAQESMADKNFPQSFRASMNKLDDNLSFERAIQFINDYAQRENIQIPTRINILRTQRISNKQPEQIEVQHPPITGPVMVSGVPVTNSIENQKNNVRIAQRINPNIIINQPHTNPVIQNVPINAHNQTFQRQISPPKYHQEMIPLQQPIPSPQFIPQKVFPAVDQQRIRTQRHQRNLSGVTRQLEITQSNYSPQQRPIQIRTNHHETIRQNETTPLSVSIIQRKSPDTRVLGTRKIEHVSAIQQTNQRPNPIINQNRNIQQNHVYNSKHQIVQRNNNIVQTHHLSKNFQTQTINHNWIQAPQPFPKPILPAEHLNNSVHYIQPDNLNQKLDMLSATIANIHKQFQGDKLKNY